MTRLAIIGDVHLDCKAPSSRKDDYPTTVFDKLNQVYRIAKKHDASAIICTGDLFSRKSMPIEFLVRTIEFFKTSYKTFEIKFITVAGNHDLHYGRSDTMPKTPIGLLAASGAVVANQPFCEVQGITIGLFDYDRTTDNELIYKSDYDISVVHKYTHPTYKNDEDFIDLKSFCGKTEVIVAGHDHLPYEPLDVRARLVLRPGSLTRNTSSIQDQERPVFVNILEFNAKGQFVVSTEKLDIKPVEDIYYEEKLATKVTKKELIEFIDDLKKSPSRSSGALDILKELCKGDTVLYNTCSEYLRSFSIV